MIVTKDKTLVHGDLLIDDKPRVTGTRSPAWQHVLYDQPYNRHVDAQRMTWSTWREVLLRPPPSAENPTCSNTAPSD